MLAEQERTQFPADHQRACSSSGFAIIAGSEDLRDELIKTSVKELHATIEVMDQLGAVGADDKEAAATATRTLAGIYQQAGGLMDDFERYDDAIRIFARWTIWPNRWRPATPDRSTPAGSWPSVSSRSASSR